MALASTEDIGTRLGRDLTGPEEEMAQQVIDLVTGLIEELTGEDTEDLDPVPASLTALCIKKVIGIGTNPEGLEAETEVLGAYQHQQSFNYDGCDIFLTREERKQVRRAFGLSSFKAVTLESPYSGDDEFDDELLLGS